jgi:hypothetical protein
VSVFASLIQTVVGAAADVSPASLVRVTFQVSVYGALAMFFKPLLTGIARALVLVVKPRRTKDEIAARRQMRDAQLLQRMINSSNGPSHAAELRALAARA